MRRVSNNSVGLGGVSVVRLDESAELMFAADGAVALRAECPVEDFVVYADSASRSLGVVVA